MNIYLPHFFPPSGSSMIPLSHSFPIGLLTRLVHISNAPLKGKGETRLRKNRAKTGVHVSSYLDRLILISHTATNKEVCTTSLVI